MAAVRTLRGWREAQGLTLTSAPSSTTPAAQARGEGTEEHRKAKRCHPPSVSRVHHHGESRSWKTFPGKRVRNGNKNRVPPWTSPSASQGPPKEMRGEGGGCRQGPGTKGSGPPFLEKGVKSCPTAEPPGALAGV